jgi:5-methylcytosine-specific restriction enzyme subunit McrC
VDDPTEAILVAEKIDSVIPVRNAWYLLLYAWDMAVWKDRWKGDVEASPHLLGLLARILAETAELLMSRQLRRAYEPHQETILGIRGRIDFATSLKRRTFEKGSAHCAYSQLTVNTLKNRIIRSTLNRLAKNPRVSSSNASNSKELYHRLRKIDHDLEGVSLKRVESSDFSRLQLTRNDQDYFLPISICALIHRLEMPTEDVGDHALNALFRDEITFHKLFELFVCNFYRYHLTKCKVSYQEKLSWFDVLNNLLVPAMNTDITLDWPGLHRRMVIDTKYSIKTLTASPYGGPKFKSENLYQIYTYLRTQEHRSQGHLNAQGMLLYPTTSSDLHETMLVQGHKIHVATVNLAASWESIEERLQHLAGFNC